MSPTHRLNLSSRSLQPFLIGYEIGSRPLSIPPTQELYRSYSTACGLPFGLLLHNLQQRSLLLHCARLLRERWSALGYFRCARSSSRSSESNSKYVTDRPPCLSALLLLMALPSSVFGPVEHSHGFQFRISSACLARRSGDHPDDFRFMAGVLQ